MYYNLVLVYMLGAMALMMSLTQQVVFLITGSMILYFGWTADIFITISALMIRVGVVDPERFKTVIWETHLPGYAVDRNNPRQFLRPERYLNFMPLAMIVGLIGSIVIHYYEILGGGIYLVMQVLFIFAFSGIISMRRANLLGPKLKKITIGVSLFWIVAATGVLSYFIYAGAMDEIILWGGTIVYMIAIVIMAILTFINYAYRQRTHGFRLMLCLGAIFFVVSDFIIGFNFFIEPFYLAPLLFYPFWVLAIFCLQYAVLFLRTKSDTPIFKK